MSLGEFAKYIKNEYADKFLRQIEGFIKKIPIDGKYQNFIFTNINRLSQKKKDFLEEYKLQKKEFKHITKYKIRGVTGEIIIVKLHPDELYKIDDVLTSEFFEGKPFYKNYGNLIREFLRVIYPQREIWQRYCESRLYFCINNYQNYKDEGPYPYLWQSFLDGYKYIIEHIKGNSILDIGSCEGYLPILCKLKKPELEVTASDINYEYMGFPRNYCDRHNLKINFIKLNILQPKIQKKFDTTVSFHVLEHFKEKKNITVIKNHIKLAQMRAILVVPFEEFITTKRHKQILNIEKLEKIVQRLGHPYKIEQISGWNRALIIDR